MRLLGFVKGKSTAWCNRKQLAWKDDISQSKSLSWVKYNTIATNYQLDNRSANKGNAQVFGNFTANNCIIRLKPVITLYIEKRSDSTEDTYGSINVYTEISYQRVGNYSIRIDNPSTQISNTITTSNLYWYSALDYTSNTHLMQITASYHALVRISGYIDIEYLNIDSL